MTKAFALIIGCLILVHLIRPVGLPGLRKRSDAWKLAVIAIAVIALTVAFKAVTDMI